MIVAFSGGSYKNDCGIFLSDTMHEFEDTARLQLQGVVISIPSSRVEEIRSALEKELEYKIKVFTPPPGQTF